MLSAVARAGFSHQQSHRTTAAPSGHAPVSASQSRAATISKTWKRASAPGIGAPRIYEMARSPFAAVTGPTQMDGVKVMASITNGDDNKVVQFPLSAEERRALRKQKQDLERQRLIRCFVDEAGRALFHTADGKAYADLIIDGTRQTWPVRSRQFRFEYIRFVKREWEARAERSEIMALTLGPSLKKSAINQAIDEFEARAICSSIEREVHVRVAADRDDLYIDVCDRDWHAVRITAGGWSVVQSPPVRFRRTAGMQPLPFPERGTSLDALRPFLNVNGGDFVLVVGWLLMALQPQGPYPIIAAIGEQGSAKTSLMRFMRSLVDPSTVPSGSLPFSGRDLFIAAHNSHVQAFENVSKLTPTMSDHLCRLATGGGIRTRALYTDSDETLLRTSRPIMLEGISNYITRADLLDRSLVFAIERLSSHKTERAMRAEFERLRPGIFGALLDHLVTGLQQRSDIQLTQLPRMADFTLWAAACGLDTFEQAYAANRQAAIETLLEHDALARALQALVQREWSGTASDLLDALPPVVKVANAKVLSDELRRLAPMLRTIGLDIQHQRTMTKRGITIIRRA
jgi:hypothetical protein